MSRVQVHDKVFELNIASETIQTRIDELAVEINRDLGDKRPLFVVVLSGAFIFASDLIRRFEGHCEVAFIKVSSYSGTSSTGQVKSILGIDRDLSGRSVVVVEDIVDTGDTAVFLLDEIGRHAPSELRFATFLFKPSALRQSFQPDYVGFEVPNDFLVGYGLDYDGHGRNYDAIYKLCQ